jgi:hypothetical protein
MVRRDGRYHSSHAMPRLVFAITVDTFTRSLSLEGIGGFMWPGGRLAGGSGGLDMLNLP